MGENRRDGVNPFQFGHFSLSDVFLDDHCRKSGDAVPGNNALVICLNADDFAGMPFEGYIIGQCNKPGDIKKDLNALDAA
ncbi:hypothetical protein [Metabacillus sp. RGM 3146]|uniref:hypothetical protein n=1 Tax=Metabacillus sp. RGM 3146 TaxID=3401092 RepID=UPI003B9C6FE1